MEKDSPSQQKTSESHLTTRQRMIAALLYFFRKKQSWIFSIIFDKIYTGLQHL
jgi:hypothetical protein